METRFDSPKINPHHQTGTYYRPLDHARKEIRLLTLKPGSKDDPVCCTFEHSILSQEYAIPYETISYVWGNSLLHGHIYLHGHLIDVPRSAEAVLRRMRLTDRERIVWIDAVCINQTDTAERNSQVAMMADIYGMTSTNLIWLGDDDDVNTEKANASISAILNDVKNETKDFQELTKQIYGTWGNMLYSNKPILAHVDWDPLLRYFASPWFTRLWIVQEASLPAKSICHRGTSTRPLEDILRVAMWILHKASTLPYGYALGRGLKCAAGTAMYADHTYGRHEIIYHRGGRATTVDLLMGALHEYDAYDARDHVYGMLGLYRKYMRCTELPSALAPDYSAALSKVFRDVARLIVSETASLRLLRDIHCRSTADSAEHWPSWVPQWHVVNDKYSNQRELNVSGICADADVKLDVSALGTMQDPNVLTVKGVILGTISRSTPEFTRDQIEVGGTKAMRALLNCAHTMDDEFTHDSQANSERLAHTLTTGLDGYVQRITSSKSAELYSAFRGYIFDLDRFPCGLEHVNDRTALGASYAASYSQALANACFDRCIFATSSNHLGRGPSASQVGDVVAVLFGSSFPMVLRPFNEQHCKYGVVGYCYVYGIMEGEVVNAHRLSKQEDSIFHLH